MRVLFLASEAYPFVKVGGLADVAGSLPKVLNDFMDMYDSGDRFDIRVCIPFYKCINAAQFNLSFAGKIQLPTSNGVEEGEVYTTRYKGIVVYFIRNAAIESDDVVYNKDTEKAGDKFIFFSLASLEWMKLLNWIPDIIHANDWHTALALYAANGEKQSGKSFVNSHFLITLHNLPFMGAGTESALRKYLIPPSKDPLLPEWAKILPLAMGLSAAEKIVAVSPNYARELLTQEFGCSLQNYMSSKKSKIIGILNGLDISIWDPSRDKLIKMPFSLTDIQNKSVNKIFLLKKLGLNPDPGIPLLIMVSRLDQQKGVDLAVDCLRMLGGIPWQAILLGTGDSVLEEQVRHLEMDYPNSVRSLIRFDSQLSHQLYAAGDILLMPSRYEPCGLSQLIALKYGCIPVVRSTGGLKDTVINHTAQSIGNGFTFNVASADALKNALIKAIDSFHKSNEWKKIIENGMKKDFSWGVSAKKYFSLYKELLEKA
jgi:starch synthase